MKKLIAAAAIALVGAATTAGAATVPISSQVNTDHRTKNLIYTTFEGYSTPISSATLTYSVYDLDAPEALSMDFQTSAGKWITLQSFKVLSDNTNFVVNYVIDLASWADEIASGLKVLWEPGKGGVDGPEVTYVSLDVTPAAVPLPASGLLLAGAFGGIAALRRRRKAA